MLLHIFLCSNTHEHTNAPNGKHQGHAVCSRISPQRYSRLEPSGQSFSLAHRVRGAQAISAGSDQLNAIWSARLFIRFQPFLPIKPFSSTRFFIDKEVVFSTFACSPCSRRSSYFLASAFPQAEFRLCRHKPLSIFTICFSDDLKLKPFPSGFHRSRGCGAFGLFFVSPAARRLLSFRGGAGGLSLWGLAPRTYYVFETHITDILILLYLYNSFVIYAPPHIRAGGKMATIVCRAANLRRARFLCAERKITLETENRRKCVLRRRGERHGKAPRFFAGGGG